MTTITQPSPSEHTLLDEALARGIGAPEKTPPVVDPLQSLQHLREGDGREMLGGYLLGQAMQQMQHAIKLYGELRPNSKLPTKEDGTLDGKAVVERLGSYAKCIYGMWTKVTPKQKRYFEVWLDYSVRATMVDHFVGIVGKGDENGPAPAPAVGEQSGDIAIPTPTTTGGSTA